MRKSITMILMLTLLTSCLSLQQLKKPEASIKKFSIDSISMKDITFKFDIAVVNPYPLGLKLGDISFDFYIEDKSLMKTTAKGPSIKSLGESVTPLLVKVTFADIMKIVKLYTSKEYLDCTVNIATSIPLPDIAGRKNSIPLKFSLKKKIPAIKPEISIANFKVKTPSADEAAEALKQTGRDTLNSKKIIGVLDDLLNGRKAKIEPDLSALDLKVSVDFDVELTNKTKSRLNFKDLNYDFTVNSEKLVAGKTDRINNTPEGKSVIHVSNSFSTKSLSKSLINAFKNKQAAYALTGFSSIKLPDEMSSEPVRFNFNEKGSLNIK